MTTKAENVTGPVAGHAEGPCWSKRWSGLRFVDMDRGDILTLRRENVVRLPTGRTLASFVRPRADGGYVVGVEQGIGIADDVDLAPSRFITLFNDPNVRMNDGGIAPDGHLFAGTMHRDAQPGAGSLYRIDGTHSSLKVLRDITISNGIAFSPCGELAYYVDSATSAVEAFDYERGRLLNRRTLIRVSSHHGTPDGICVDASGNIWVAMWGGSAVRAYSPDGKLQEIIEVAALQVSACTFGDDDLSTLYITTSSQGQTRGADPEAGSLFKVRPGEQGIPTPEFAG